MPDSRTSAGPAGPGGDAAATDTAELVARANRGDRAAWDQLVERYGGMVWAVARGHGLSVRDASDVSHVTWLLLTQHLAALRQPEGARTWLLRTATREAYRMRRLRGYEAPVVARAAGPVSGRRLASE